MNTGEVIALIKAFGGGGGSSGGGVLEISVDNDTGALSKTWQEIHDAMMSGKLCIVMDEYNDNVRLTIITGVAVEGIPGGSIGYGVFGNNMSAYADSANGYPVWN